MHVAVGVERVHALAFAEVFGGVDQIPILAALFERSRTGEGRFIDLSMFEAMSDYLVPLMVGTRNIAFPRLNAYSYYLYVFGGIMFYVAFLMNTGADRGWFAYVPLSGPDYAPGKRADFWAQLITFTEVSALAVAVETIVTVFRLRAPANFLGYIGW